MKFLPADVERDPERLEGIDFVGLAVMFALAIGGYRLATAADKVPRGRPQEIAWRSGQ